MEQTQRLYAETFLQDKFLTVENLLNLDDHYGGYRKVHYNYNTKDEDMDPKQYRDNRLKTLAARKKEGLNPYPQDFQVTMSIPEFIQKYKSLNSEEYLEDVQVCLAGRLMNKFSTPNMIFYDLAGSGGQVQVIAHSKISTFSKGHSRLKCGDIIGIVGFPGKTRTGVLSVISRSVTGLSYCLRKMPPMHPAVKKIDMWTPGSVRNPDGYILKDQETRYHQRFLDLTINREVKHIFKTRAKIVSYIRNFLDNLDFLEVETPILTTVTGGASASPFVTRHNDLNVKKFMRFTPKTYLKQLVVGGIERVYEIGKQFRNEGIDLTHNTEFTTCEFCMTYADYKDLMELTEQMLSGMVKELTGGYKVTYHANGYDNNPIEIDFTPPFRRIYMIEELEKMANVSIPKDLASDEATEYLVDACTKFDINCPPPQTTTRLLNKLVGHFVEDTCVNPTFIMDHPEIMSPLAKSHRSKPGLSECFELFINKSKLVTAYAELNDPVIQRQRFSDQLKDQQSTDEETTLSFDETFCEALECGMPPTAGWGLGIDKLTMLLTDSQNIKEVILFPDMKPQPCNELPIKEDEPLGDNVESNVEDDDQDDTTWETVAYDEARSGDIRSFYEACSGDIRSFYVV